MAKRGRGGSGSAARLANIMTGQAYQAAVERGKKSATGAKLKERRKKMTSEADKIISEAEDAWRKQMEEYGAAPGTKTAGWVSALASLAGMVPGPHQAYMVPLAIAAQGYGAHKQSEYTKEFFDENRGDFIDPADLKQFGGSFLDDYIKDASVDIEDAWKSQERGIRDAIMGGFATNAILSLAQMGAGQGKGGVGKPDDIQDGKNVINNLNASTNVSNASTAGSAGWFDDLIGGTKSFIGKNWIDPNTGGINLNATNVTPGSAYTGSFDMTAGGPAYGRTQVTPGASSLGVKWGLMEPGQVGLLSNNTPVVNNQPGVTTTPNPNVSGTVNQPTFWDQLKNADWAGHGKGFMGASASLWNPTAGFGYTAPWLADPYNATRFASAYKQQRPSYLSGFNQGYWM